MHLDEFMDSASSSSSTLHDCDYDYDVANEERIRRLVLSIRLSSRRNKILHEGEEDELKRIHLRLENLILKGCDSRKRRRLFRLLPTANRFRELLFYLRKLRDSGSSVSAAKYFSKMHEALTAVMSQSFEEEYRKTADLLGVLDALAEGLICDVELFGVKCLNENVAIRKLIANSLTNLSFGSLQRKRRLCCYPNFIEYTVKVIGEMQILAQAYASLLRNLSWNADPDTSKQLHCTVPSLIQASMRARAEKDNKCLCATLSALWNMSFCSQNQQTICQNSRFLETLVDLLVHDPQQTAVAEASTGVLKYASHCFSQNTGDYMHVNVLQKMVLRLIDLLKSSSFTTINNCLYVLQQLLKYDYQLRIQIRSNQKAMPILYHLCNSKVMDVKNTVKTILEYLETKKCQSLVNSLESPEIDFQRNALTDGLASVYNSNAVPASSYFDSPHLLKLRVAKHCSPTVFPAEDDIDEGTGSLSSVALDGTSSNHGLVFTGVPQQIYANCMYRNNVIGQNYSTEIKNERKQAPNISDYENLSFDCYEKVNCDKKEPVKLTNDDVSECDGEDIDFDESETEENQLLYRSFEIGESVRCTRNSSTQSLRSVSLKQSDSNPKNAELLNKNIISTEKGSEPVIKETVKKSSTDDSDYGNLEISRMNGTAMSFSNLEKCQRTEITDDFITKMIDQAQPKVSTLPRKSLSDSAKPTVDSKAAVVAASSSLPSCEILYLACV